MARALLALARQPHSSSTPPPLTLTLATSLPGGDGGAVGGSGSVASDAAALRLGRKWRDTADAAARRRRRATLAGFGSTVMMDESSGGGGGGGGGTAAAGGAKRSAGVADRDDVDDELSAVRGAAAWAMDLLLAPGSAAVRSEAASLVRHVAADGERQRFAVLARLVGAY